jgi:uncharacterized repeat protein (TIGR03847 family)
MEALSLALDRLLAEVSGGVILRKEAQADLAKPPGAPSDFPEDPDVDFRVAQLTIGFDEEEEAVVLLATPLTLEEREGELVQREDAEPQFAARISRQQAIHLTTNIAGALAGGRPRCPLCGQPLDDSHVCVKQNGYHPVELN